MVNSLVSIILPVYNGETYLAQSIKSCLNQTYRNIELIIVNDCSTDNTLAIAENFAKNDARVRIVNNSTNKRLPASLNIGHNLAKGDLLTWTSDDNLYLSTAIEIMVRDIKQKSVDFVYANFIQINSKGNQTRLFNLEEPEELLWRNVVGACFLYKKEVFYKLNGYDESLFMVEDYDFWLRAFMEFKFYHIDDILYRYRIHSGSLTNEIKNKKSEKQLIYETNKYKMFSKVFKPYRFPEKLQELIIEFQKSHKINHEIIIQNYNEFMNFYKTLKRGNYKNYRNYLKDKFIKGIRQEKKNQGIITFIYLIKLFSQDMSLNDYKTSVKILTHKVFNK